MCESSVRDKSFYLSIYTYTEERKLSVDPMNGGSKFLANVP